MTKRTRRTHAPSFRAKVALAAIKGEKTLAALAQQYDVHPTRSRPGRPVWLRPPRACSAQAARHLTRPRPST